MMNNEKSDGLKSNEKLLDIILEKNQTNFTWTDINIETPALGNNNLNTSPTHPLTIDSICTKPPNPFDDQLIQDFSPLNVNSSNENSFFAENMNNEYDIAKNAMNSKKSKRFKKNTQITKEKVKIKEKIPFWIELLHGHPIHIFCIFKSVVFLPILLFISIFALTGSNWQNSKLRGPLNVTTKLSISGIERITSFHASDGISTIRELPVSYVTLKNGRSSVTDPYCNAEKNYKEAMDTIGVDQKLDIEKIQSDRLYRLALFKLLHGAVFRDISCKYIAKLYAISVTVTSFIILGIFFLLCQLVIILIHVFSTSRAADARLAYSFAFPKNNQINNVTGVLTVLNEENLKTVIKSDNDTDSINMPNTNVVSYLEEYAEKSSESKVSNKNCESNCNTSRIKRLVINGSWRVAVERCWWQPLSWTQSWLNINLEKNNPRHYILVSLLEGPCSLLSAIAMMFYLIALLVYQNAIKLPLCVNLDTTVSNCNLGVWYFVFVFCVLLSIINFLSHFFSGEICYKIQKIQDRRNNNISQENFTEIYV